MKEQKAIETAVMKAALKVLTQRRKCIEKYRITLAKKRVLQQKKTVKVREPKAPKAPKEPKAQKAPKEPKARKTPKTTNTANIEKVSE